MFAFLQFVAVVLPNGERVTTAIWIVQITDFSVSGSAALNTSLIPDDEDGEVPVSSSRARHVSRFCPSVSLTTIALFGEGRHRWVQPRSICSFSVSAKRPHPRSKALVNDHISQESHSSVEKLLFRQNCWLSPSVFPALGSPTSSERTTHPLQRLRRPR